MVVLILYINFQFTKPFLDKKKCLTLRIMEPLSFKTILAFVCSCGHDTQTIIQTHKYILFLDYKQSIDCVGVKRRANHCD